MQSVTGSGMASNNRAFSASNYLGGDRTSGASLQHRGEGDSMHAMNLGRKFGDYRPMSDSRVPRPSANVLRPSTTPHRSLPRTTDHSQANVRSLSEVKKKMSFDNVSPEKSANDGQPSEGRSSPRRHYNSAASAASSVSQKEPPEPAVNQTKSVPDGGMLTVGNLSQDQLMGRLVQIKEYLKQAHEMADSIRQDKPTAENEDHLERVIKLIGHLKSQERGYTSLLQDVMAAALVAKAQKDRSVASAQAVEPEREDRDPGYERHDPRHEGHDPRHEGRDTDHEGQGSGEGRGSNESESIDLDYHSDVSEATTDRSFNATSRPKIESHLGMYVDLSSVPSTARSSLASARSTSSQFTADSSASSQSGLMDTVKYVPLRQPSEANTTDSELSSTLKFNSRLPPGASEADGSDDSQLETEEDKVKELEALKEQRDLLKKMLDQQKQLKQLHEDHARLLSLQQEQEDRELEEQKTLVDQKEQEDRGRSGQQEVRGRNGQQEVMGRNGQQVDRVRSGQEEEDEGSDDDMRNLEQRLTQVMSQLVWDDGNSKPVQSPEKAQQLGYHGDDDGESDASEMTSSACAEGDSERGALMTRERRELQGKLAELRAKKSSLDRLMQEMSDLREQRVDQGLSASPKKGDFRTSDDESVTSSLAHLRNSKEASMSANQTAGQAETMLEVMQMESKLRKLDELKGRLRQLGQLSQYYSAGRKFIDSSSTSDNESERAESAAAKEDDDWRTQYASILKATDMEELRKEFGVAEVAAEIDSLLPGEESASESQDYSLMGNIMKSTLSQFSKADADKIKECLESTGGLSVSPQRAPSAQSPQRAPSSQSQQTGGEEADDTQSLLSEAMQKYRNDREIQQKLQVLHEAKARLAELQRMVSEGGMPDESHLDFLTSVLQKHLPTTTDDDDETTSVSTTTETPTTASVSVNASPVKDSGVSMSALRAKQTNLPSGFNGSRGVPLGAAPADDELYPDGCSDVQENELADLRLKLRMLEATKTNLLRKQAEQQQQAWQYSPQEQAKASVVKKMNGHRKAEVTFEEPESEYLTQELPPPEPKEKTNDRLWDMMREQRIAQEELRQKMHEMETILGRPSTRDVMGMSMYSGGATQATWGSARSEGSEEEDESSSSSEEEESSATGGLALPNRSDPSPSKDDDGFPTDGYGQYQAEEEEEAGVDTQARGQRVNRDMSQSVYAGYNKENVRPNGSGTIPGVLAQGQLEGSLLHEFRGQLEATTASCRQVARDQQRLSRMLTEHLASQGMASQISHDESTQQTMVTTAALSHCLSQVGEQRELFDQLCAHVGMLTDHVQYLEEELMPNEHKPSAEQLEYPFTLDPSDFMSSGVDDGRTPSQRSLSLISRKEEVESGTRQSQPAGGTSTADRYGSDAMSRNTKSASQAAEAKGVVPPLNMKKLSQRGVTGRSGNAESRKTATSQGDNAHLMIPSLSAIASGRQRVPSPFGSTMYKPGLSAGICGTAYDSAPVSAASSAMGTPKHNPNAAKESPLRSNTQSVADGIAKIVSDIESETECGSDLSLFEALRETIYSEVATLISQNEERPHYLIELFRQLQLFTSDYLRQSALYAHRELISKFIQESSSLAGSVAGNDDVGTKNESSPAKQNEDSQFRAWSRAFDRMGGADPEGTPSESIVTSDDDLKSPKSLRAALAAAFAGITPSGSFSTSVTSSNAPSNTANLGEMTEGSVSNEPYDYVEVVDNTSSGLSTPSYLAQMMASTEPNPAPTGGSFFGKDEPLEETVINLTEAMKRVRDYEQQLKDESDEGGAAASEQNQSEVSSSAQDDGEEDNASEKTVELMSSHVDTKTLDLHIRSIMRKVIPVLKEHVLDVCSPRLITLLWELVLSLTLGSQLNSQGPAAGDTTMGDTATGDTATHSPGPHGDHNASNNHGDDATGGDDQEDQAIESGAKTFLTQQLPLVLRNTMDKYLGQQVKDCAPEMLTDISEVLFNELAFSKLMEELAATGAAAAADITSKEANSSSPGGADAASSQDQAKKDESEGEGEKEGGTGESSPFEMVESAERQTEDEENEGDDEENEGEGDDGFTDGPGENGARRYELLTSDLKAMNIIGSDEDFDDDSNDSETSLDNQSDTAVSREAQKEREESDSQSVTQLATDQGQVQEDDQSADPEAEEEEPKVIVKVNQAEILSKMKSESQANTPLKAAIGALDQTPEGGLAGSDDLPTPPPPHIPTSSASPSAGSAPGGAPDQPGNSP